jgi:hypothetical protein
MSPQALMQVYHHLNGQTPPPCTLLAIRGETFELGQPLGVNAQAHLKAALQWAWQLLESSAFQCVVAQSCRTTK